MKTRTLGLIFLVGAVLAPPVLGHEGMWAVQQPAARAV